MNNRRPWFVRFRWDKLVAVIVAVYMAYLCFSFVGKSVFYYVVPDHYEIHYVEHLVKPGENLFEIVQLYEDYYPYDWDVREMVGIAVDVNELSSSHYIKAGFSIYVPVATKGLPPTSR